MTNDDVIAKLEKLVISHALDAKAIDDVYNGQFHDQIISDRDRYVAHTSSAVSFALAIELLRGE